MFVSVLVKKQSSTAISKILDFEYVTYIGMPLLKSIRKKTGMTALSQNKTKEVDCTPVRFTAEIWKMCSFKKNLLEQNLF